jgi:N-acyl-D-aspartate/D-glutamate deacylase
LWDPVLETSSAHGVTTVVMGNCGVGFAPERPVDRPWTIARMEGVMPAAVLEHGLGWEWENPKHQGFIDGLHKLGTYEAADLTCQPLDISLTNFGKTPTSSCQYFVTFKNGKSS